MDPGVDSSVSTEEKRKKKKKKRKEKRMNLAFITTTTTLTNSRDDGKVPPVDRYILSSSSVLSNSLIYRKAKEIMQLISIYIFLIINSVICYTEKQEISTDELKKIGKYFFRLEFI